MTHFRRSTMLNSKTRLKYWVASILLIITFVPAKAEKTDVRNEGGPATASVGAKIHRPFQVRSENLPEPKKKIGQKPSDVSVRDCDTETQRLIKNCIFMIYEIQ